MRTPFHRNRGFTLVELLVVIGIIALLISILLPSLARARSAAVRLHCLSNQRQLATLLQMYATQFKGAFPPQLKGVDSYQSSYCFYTGWDDYPGEYETKRFSADGWVGLGYLVRSKLIKNGKGFYCPGMQDLPVLRYESYEAAWTRVLAGNQLSNDALFLGYNYRVFYQAVTPWITQGDVDKLANLKMGKLSKFKGIISLTSDYPWFYNNNTWAHTKPYGLCVGFSDGHGEFVDFGKKNYDTVVDLTRTYTRNDQHNYFFYYWFAMDRADTTEFGKLVAARNWSGAMTRYGHY